LLNSAYPDSAEAQSLCDELTDKYGVNSVCVNCLELSEADITDIIKSALYEFPITSLVYFCRLDRALPMDHDLKSLFIQYPLLLREWDV
jgi:stage IV sporulation protein A